MIRLVITKNVSKLYSKILKRVTMKLFVFEFNQE